MHTSLQALTDILEYIFKSAVLGKGKQYIKYIQYIIIPAWLPLKLIHDDSIFSTNPKVRYFRHECATTYYRKRYYKEESSKQTNKFLLQLLFISEIHQIHKPY